jgi:hypothetical protein
MKTFIAFAFILYACSLSAATSIDGCGEFRAMGEIVKNTHESGYSLVVNQNSKSEYQFKIKIQDELKISSFISSNIEVIFKMNRVMNGMKGEVEKILKIKKIPAKTIELSKKNNIELVAKSECVK